MEQSVEAMAVNLRCHRDSRGLSLDQLAVLTGVSKSMLRQIETGKSSPTIATIWKIANGLKLSFSALLCKQSVEAEVKSLRAEKPLTDDGGHYRVYPLIPFDPQQSFETYYLEIDPETIFQGEPHNGNVYEYLFVQKGELHLSIEGNEYKICEGEFLRFLANSPHEYRCVGDEMATAIMQLSYHL
ncbi:MAG: transcriptional regulator with XRE-family HTH domain [Desulforhopalus sp.]|jgi:transcriptional regulator with XRE-family HTH domain